MAGVTIWIIAIAMLLTPSVTLAQRTVGQVRIEVRDAAGAPVDASGTIESDATHVRRALTIDATGVAPEKLADVQKTAAENVKRYIHFDGDEIGWTDDRLSQSPYAIFEFQEMKTVWHPMGM